MSQSYTSVKSYLGKVKEIRELKVEALAQFKRAGVFVSVKNNTEKNYLFSIQIGSIDNTPFIRDFGGHIEKGEHPIDAALRELQEESLGIFSTYITDEMIDNCSVHGFVHNLYIFLELRDINIPSIIKQFDEARQALPEDSPEFLKETVRIISINRNSIFKNMKLKHHVKEKQTYYGPNLWKIIRAFVFVI